MIEAYRRIIEIPRLKNSDEGRENTLNEREENILLMQF
jgi:hypothetical protein